MLSLENVHLKYPAKVVLENVSLQVRQGEFVIIIGPSGCGKSSLLNIAAGTLQPTSGRVWYGQELVTTINPYCGIMFQDPCLFPWLTAWENVSFGLKMKGLKKDERYQRAITYLDQVGLKEYFNYHSYELSGGMRQRVALARTLIQEPQLILMDEPLGALDAITKRKMQDLFLQIYQKTQKTFVLVTHDVEEAVKLGTRLLIMSSEGGRIRNDIVLQLGSKEKTDYVTYIYQLLEQNDEM